MQTKDRTNFFSTTNTKFKTIEGLIEKLQSSGEKSKLKFHQNVSDYYDEMNYLRQINTFQLEESPLSKIGHDYA